MSEVEKEQDKCGCKRWYLNGDLHREDGPARTWPNSTREEWLLHGKAHREDGPAYISVSGHKGWWLHGVRLLEWQHTILVHKQTFFVSTLETNDK